MNPSDQRRRDVNKDFVEMEFSRFLGDNRVEVL